jgi:hypothetical protein
VLYKKLLSGRGNMIGDADAGFGGT